MSKIKFGIIGLGNQGSYYTNLFKTGQIERGEISALCDLNEIKIKKDRVCVSTA